MIKIAISSGDLNGIAPEIIVKSLNQFNSDNTVKNFTEFHLFSSYSLLNYYSKKLGLLDLAQYKNVIIHDMGEFISDVGKPTVNSGLYSYLSLKESYTYAEKNNAVLVTPPISKESLKIAGFNFSGHTELLEKWNKSVLTIMMFLSETIKCALLTIHVPLINVASKLKLLPLESYFKLITKTLKRDLFIENPKIALLGINPHAGENGNIGTEEIELFMDIIKKSDQRIDGPFPADTFFGSGNFKKYDLYISAYHDQGLIPFKLLTFSKGVNFTAGLSIIRTSPDHGTAFDIAGKNIANPGSMIEAIKWGVKLHKNRIIVNE